jgi:methionyl-tRNA formyltransferase
MKNYVVAAIGPWNKRIFKIETKKFKDKWWYISDPKKLETLINNKKPDKIFFIHWRWIVPEKIIRENLCVCFHMTNLPYGRGGSPLQNLILQGHKKTKLSAFRMTMDLDAGPIYLKREMSLDGSALDIYKRASYLAWKIIKIINSKNIKPKPQKGKIKLFKRRKLEDSIIPKLNDANKLYDFIRMLDAPGYPRAYVSNGKLEFELYNAKLINNKITFKVSQK